MGRGVSNLATSEALPLSHCPLCHSERVVLHARVFHAVPWRLYAPGAQRDDGLSFFRCEECSLVIKDPTVRATSSQERRHYEKHNNDLADVGYREHLLRLVQPLLQRVPPNSLGLDYGCGPVLSIEPLAKEAGARCFSYDPIFVPRGEVLTADTYDWISCSEVAEHFKEPRSEFLRLRELLKMGGVLGVMTRFVPEKFSSWWYHRDPTHVVFYTERTFNWLGDQLCFDVIERCGDVVLLAKR